MVVHVKNCHTLFSVIELHYKALFKYTVWFNKTFRFGGRFFRIGIRFENNSIMTVIYVMVKIPSQRVPVLLRYKYLHHKTKQNKTNS